MYKCVYMDTHVPNTLYIWICTYEIFICTKIHADSHKHVIISKQRILYAVTSCVCSRIICIFVYVCIIMYIHIFTYTYTHIYKYI